MEGIKGVKKGGSKRPPRIVLYGAPGIGKTSFAAAMPSPIMVTTEDGADNIPVDQFEKATTWQQFLDNIAAVIKEASNGTV